MEGQYRSRPVPPILRHRIVRNFKAEAEGVATVRRLFRFVVAEYGTIGRKNDGMPRTLVQLIYTYKPIVRNFCSNFGCSLEGF